MKKECKRCNCSKNIEEFGTHPTKGRQSYCKKCNTEYQREWYAKNKRQHIQNLNRRRKEARFRNREFITEYLKTHPCVDCGTSNILVLEFDHVRGKKIGPISSMITNGESLKKIEREINKCEVRCANCHRIRTLNTLDRCFKIK